MRRFYWGAFFIACGLIFLASNLGLLNIDFSIVRKSWPLLFIFWGVSLLFNNKKIKVTMTIISAILVAGVVFAFFHGIGNGFHAVTNWHRDADTTKVVTLTEDYDSTIQEAELNFSGGAGEFMLKDSTELLVDGTQYGNNSRGKIISKRLDNKAILQMDVNPFDRVVRNGVLTQRTKVKLNPNPIWDINFSVGAAETEIDLTGFKTRDINIDAGAASIDLKLGSRFARTTIEISAGASSITINVPKESFCSITSESALSSFDTADGFTEISDNSYQTDNRSTAKSEIEISVDAGVSSIEINRY